MSMLRGLHITKLAISEFLSLSPSQAQIQKRISALEKQISHCERFYPWPALTQSFAKDIATLKRFSK